MTSLPQRLEQILQRCKAATPGEWVINDTACLSLRSAGTNEQIIGSISVPYEWEHEWTAAPEDIEFISHARTDLPLVTRALQLAIGRLEGFANSAIYDRETKWAEGVLADITAILGGGK